MTSIVSGHVEGATRASMSGRPLEGNHDSTRVGLFALIPHRNRDEPALVAPDIRACVLDVLHIGVGNTHPDILGTRPQVRRLARRRPNCGTAGHWLRGPTEFILELSHLLFGAPNVASR